MLHGLYRIPRWSGGRSRRHGAGIAQADIDRQRLSTLTVQALPAPRVAAIRSTHPQDAVGTRRRSWKRMGSRQPWSVRSRVRSDRWREPGEVGAHRRRVNRVVMLQGRWLRGRWDPTFDPASLRRTCQDAGAGGTRLVGGMVQQGSDVMDEQWIQ